MGAGGSSSRQPQIISASRDTTVRVWDFESGSCRKILSQHKFPVTSIATTTESGGLFFSGDSEGCIYFWNLEAELVKSLKAHVGEVSALVCGPIGSLVASASRDHTACIYTAQGEEKCRMKNHTAPVTCVQFSPSGTRLVTGSEDSSVRVWDVSNGKCKFMIRNFKSWINAVAWSADGKLIATGEKDSSVKFFLAANGSFVSELTTAYSCGLCFAPTGNLLAVGDKDKVNLWNHASGLLVQSLSGHTDSVTALDFNATGTAVASGSKDSTVRVYDALSGMCVKIYKAHSAEVCSVKWFDNSRTDTNSLDQGVISDGVIGRKDTLQRTYSTRQFKVLVVGDAGGGKTSLVRQSCDGYFSDKYKATIGVDFAVKKVAISSGFATRLALWDIAGQERLGTMTRVYYKGATAALVVIDVTIPSALENAALWKKDIDDKVTKPDGTPIPVVLLANKCDLKVAHDDEILDAFCKKHNFVSWMFTSAKKNINIDEFCKLVIEKIMSQIDASHDDKEEDATIFSLAPDSHPPALRRDCCT